MGSSMFKRFFLSLVIAAGLLSPSFGAGTIPFSLSQQLDQFGKPLSACQFYTIQAGTTSTPQSAYQDSALTLALPNPQTCDSAGRLPQMFLADGSIKVRLTDRNGVTQIVADNIQVIGNSSGGGGGSPVDPTTVLTTGDVKVVYGTGVVTGFVRLNGRTIGSATSGASERANADCQALFQYLWGADPNLVVSTGRGVSANADWTANKQLTLPDFRSRALAGLGDMGNSDNALFSGVTFTLGNSTTLGSLLGAAQRTLLTANLPPYTPAGSFSGTSSPQVGALPNSFVSAVGGGSVLTINYASTAFVSPTVTGTFTGTPAAGQTSTPFEAVSPYALVTFYEKL